MICLLFAMVAYNSTHFWISSNEVHEVKKNYNNMYPYDADEILFAIFLLILSVLGLIFGTLILAYLSVAITDFVERCKARRNRNNGANPV